MGERLPAASGLHCGRCRFFIGEPRALEQAIPGLGILSSAYGSVRDNTGLCGRRDSFVAAGDSACSEFAQAAGDSDSRRCT